MQIKQLLINAASLLLLIGLLQACSGNSHKSDAYEKLEEPPQIVSAHITEAPGIEDETLITNGLGEKVIIQGSDISPVLILSMEFDNAWLILEQVLKHEKILVTDRNREQGYYLVSFDTDSYAPEDSNKPEESVSPDGYPESGGSFLENLNRSFFAKNYGLRKYQLSVKQPGKQTLVTAKDLGAITTPKDEADGKEEVVDESVKGPENSKRRLLATLYKRLHDGFTESEKR